MPGFSGGLQQHFVMEVFETTENNTQVLVASNWTEESTISVWGLVPESNYIISVKSVNDRGESSPVYVGGKTEGFIQSLPRAVEESRLPLLFVIVGILVSLMLLGALVTATIAIRKRRLNKYRAENEFAGAGAANGSGSGVSGSSTTGSEEVEETLAGIPLLEEAEVIRITPERKVSFRDANNICPGCHNQRPQPPPPPGSAMTPGAIRRMAQSNVDLNGAARAPYSTSTMGPNGSSSGLPVERAVVRTFSIDKMRPICGVCNPSGTTPYPAENPLDELHRSLILQANS